eukprot:TRINITY_DN47372_c0_g2_i1.p1 TRINITY_DN47372_c0_g2~~TRINITY_DN47372_c0_g2_i1.p1  ORF type:complete len:1305 (-),score=288.90 TRINITY_DN47372_c0_g2_i1:92-4006(-)
MDAEGSQSRGSQLDFQPMLSSSRAMSLPMSAPPIASRASMTSPEERKNLRSTVVGALGGLKVLGILAEGLGDVNSLKGWKNQLLASAEDDAEKKCSLSTCAFFHFFSDTCIVGFQKVAQVFEVMDGDFAYISGDLLEGIVVVGRESKGVLEVLLDDAVCDSLGTGGSFGALSALGIEHRHNFSYRAKGFVTLYKLTMDSLFLELQHHPEDLAAANEVVAQFGVSGGIIAGISQDTCQFFSGLSSQLLGSIDTSIMKRLYMPGEAIMMQNDKGTTLFLLQFGQVDILVDGRSIQHLRRRCDSHAQLQQRSAARRGATAGGMCAKESQAQLTARHIVDKVSQEVVCFGELGLMGLETSRTATLMCESACFVGLLYRTVFVRCLEMHHTSLDSKKMMAFLEARYNVESAAKRQPPMQLLKEVKIFKQVGCSDEFLDCLAEKLVTLMYLGGQVIVREGEKVDNKSMYVISSGRAAVMQGDKAVAHLQPGDAFGEAVMLGLSEKRLVTIVAQETSHVEVLSQETMIDGLNAYPNEKPKVLMIAFKQSHNQKPQLKFKVGQMVEFEDSGKGSMQRTASSGAVEVQRGVVKAIEDDGSLIVDFQLNSTTRTRRVSMSSQKKLKNVHGQEGHQMAVQSKPSWKSRQSVVPGHPNAPAGGGHDRKASALRPTMGRQGTTGGKSISGPTPSPREPSPLRDSDNDDWGEPVSRQASGVEEARKSDLAEFLDSQEQIVRGALGRSKLFGAVPASFIKELAAVSESRIYMPGETLIQEGDESDSMFILVSGKAIVYHIVPGVDRTDAQKQVAHKTTIGVLEAGSISGELSMLGVAKKRSASIEAQSICSAWEVTEAKALPIVVKYAELQSSFLDVIVQHLEHTVPACVDGVDLFQPFDRKFRLLLGLYCERRAYFTGNEIFREATPADGMFVLNVGRGSMKHKGTTLPGQSGEGSYFNVMCMLGLQKNSFCTLTAFQTCHVIVIQKSSFQQAIEQYPNAQLLKELKQGQIAAYSAWKDSIKRHHHSQRATATLIVKAMADKNPLLLGGHKDDKEVMRSSFDAWHKFASKHATRKKRTAREDKVFNLWTERKRQAISKRQFADTAYHGLLQPLSTLGANVGLGSDSDLAPPWSPGGAPWSQEGERSPLASVDVSSFAGAMPPTAALEAVLMGCVATTSPKAFSQSSSPRSISNPTRIEKHDYMANTYLSDPRILCPSGSATPRSVPPIARQGAAGGLSASLLSARSHPSRDIRSELDVETLIGFRSSRTRGRFNDSYAPQSPAIGAVKLAPLGTAGMVAPLPEDDSGDLSQLWREMVV